MAALVLEQPVFLLRTPFLSHSLFLIPAFLLSLSLCSLLSTNPLQATLSSTTTTTPPQRILTGTWTDAETR